MIPVRTRASNFVYRGPTPDIGDAWVKRAPSERAVYLDWQPSEEERTEIAAGALIRLGIYNMEPIPPVSLNTVMLLPLSAAAAAWRDRARQDPALVRGPWSIPAGYWAVSRDVWEDLQATGALDEPDGGVPALWGRPLLQTEEGDSDALLYVIHPTRAGRN